MIVRCRRSDKFVGVSKLSFTTDYSDYTEIIKQEKSVSI